MLMAIYYYEQDVKSGLSGKRVLNQYLLGVVKEHMPLVKKVDLNFIFCTDVYLLEINKEFLDHDTFTDIVTFDLSETKQELVSEIYISMERVVENALKFNTTNKRELHRVIFHGVLHLCGFKDKSKKDKDIMTEQEDKCLVEYLG